MQRRKQKLKRLTSSELNIVNIYIFVFEYRRFLLFFPPWFRSLFVICYLFLLFLFLFPITPLSVIIALGGAAAVYINLIFMHETIRRVYEKKFYSNSKNTI